MPIGKWHFIFSNNCKLKQLILYFSHDIEASFFLLISFIREAIFVPLSRFNSTTITNYTCTQCLCMNSSSQLFVNIYGKLFNPRCLLFDNHGYLMTISRINSTIARFNATDMTPIDITSGLFTDAFTVQYYNGNYYVGKSQWGT